MRCMVCVKDVLVKCLAFLLLCATFSWEYACVIILFDAVNFFSYFIFVLCFFFALARFLLEQISRSGTGFYAVGEVYRYGSLLTYCTDRVVFSFSHVCVERIEK